MAFVTHFMVVFTWNETDPYLIVIHNQMGENFAIVSHLVQNEKAVEDSLKILL